MKRTGLTRRTPLKRGTSRLKRTRLKQRGRRYAARQVLNFGPEAVLIRRLPCRVCGATPSDPHHEPPRSLGGTAKDLQPLCRRHHNVRHQIGPTRFYERYGITLEWERP